jgi:SAM-dependent methyltransferase
MTQMLPPAKDEQAMPQTVDDDLDEWEKAYVRFQSPEQEVEKFAGRLRRLGAADWSRELRWLEIFCGRGGALHALDRLGFQHAQGADLSLRLLRRYRGPHPLVVCDCRRMPFVDNCKDVVCVQGGLHHLQNLELELGEVLDEVHRILVPGGRFIMVEPWRTPLLRAILMFYKNRLLRKAWGKIDAFSRMTELEMPVYGHWLDQHGWILRQIAQRFEIKLNRAARAQVLLVARRPA